MQYSEEREQVHQAGIKLKQQNLIPGTWGNVSIRVSSDSMIITPSGLDYESLTPNDLALVNFLTLEWEGKYKPSSEMKLHAQIYKDRKNINAVIHTHSMNASTVAASRREVPPILDDMVQIIGPSIRVAKYALPSTKKIVKETVSALKGRFGALMANHGAVAIGRNIEEAFTACFVLEKSCKAFIESEFLGGVKSINKFEAHFMHQFYLRKYSKQTK